MSPYLAIQGRTWRVFVSAICRGLLPALFLFWAVRVDAVLERKAEKKPAAKVEKKPSQTGDFASELKSSTYAPVKTRDPFSRQVVAVPVSVTGQGTSAGPSAKVVPPAPINYQLEGILFEANDPAAIVNGHLITLKKPVRLETAGGDILIKAIKITRDRVVLEVDGKKMELVLAAEK